MAIGSPSEAEVDHIQYGYGALLLEVTPSRTERCRDELIDTNVRIDYGKLRHLLTVNRQLNGNFNLLRHIIGEQRHPKAIIQLSFPLDQLDQRENFLSLLHYFGLLSIRAVERTGCPGWAFPIKPSSG